MAFLFNLKYSKFTKALFAMKYSFKIYYYPSRRPKLHLKPAYSLLELDIKRN